MKVLRDLGFLLIVALIGALVASIPMLVIMAMNNMQLTTSAMLVGQWLTGPLVFFLPAVIWFLIFHRGENVWKGFKFTMPKWNAVAIAVAFTLVSLPFASASSEWLTVFELPESVQSYFDSQMVQQMKMIVMMMGDFGPLYFIDAVLLIGVMTAISEETMFRGAVRRVFSDRLGVHGTALLVGFIFSLIHFEFYGFIWRWVLGSAYVYLVYYSGSIWPSVVAHALNNSMAVVQLMFTDELKGALPQTDAEWMALATSQEMTVPTGFAIASFVATVAVVVYFWLNREKMGNNLASE